MCKPTVLFSHVHSTKEERWRDRWRRAGRLGGKDENMFSQRLSNKLIRRLALSFCRQEERRKWGNPIWNVHPPYYQRGKGKRKISGETHRHLKMFPDFLIYDRERKRHSITDRVELVALLIIWEKRERKKWCEHRRNKGLSGQREEKIDIVFIEDPSLSYCHFHITFIYSCCYYSLYSP